MLCNYHTWKTSIICQSSFFKIPIKMKSTCLPDIILSTSLLFLDSGGQETQFVGWDGGGKSGGPHLLKMIEKLPEPFSTFVCTEVIFIGLTKQAWQALDLATFW